MADELLKRVMPNNVEAEQSVIGAMLMDRDDHDCFGDSDGR